MKKYRGLITVITIDLISILVWYTALTQEGMSFTGQLAYTVAGLSLTSFALVFFLAARNKWTEKWFGGYDVIYPIHKYLSILALVTVVIHGQLIELSRGGEGGGVGKIGSVAQFLFIALIVITIIGRKLKYEDWRTIHRFMVVPYAIGLYHTYVSGIVGWTQLSVLNVWIIGGAIIGLASSAYMVLFYRRIGFTHKAKVTGLKHLSDSSLEIQMTLKKPMNFKVGQYIFFRVKQSGLEQAPHPFSISGGDGKILYISIKALGDFTTQVIQQLEIGSNVELNGPYGHLYFEKGAAKQIWIAGGVGITPFMAYLRDRTLEFPVDLYYSYRGESEALYKKFLEDYQAKNPNFKLHITDTSKSARWDPATLVSDAQTTIFMCGPSQMMNSMIKKLRSTTNSEIVYENFEFSRAILFADPILKAVGLLK